MAIKYFLYSDEQITEKNKILGPSCKQFVPGTVVVGGTRKKFTQLSDQSTISRFVDCKVVASGELSDFTYTEPTTIAKRGI